MVGMVCPGITTRHSLPSTETPLPTVLDGTMVHGGTRIVHSLISTATMPLQVPGHHSVAEMEASFTTDLMTHVL